MKFSTILAVLSVSLAAAVCGCRYDKSHAAGAGVDADGNSMSIDIASESGDISVADEAMAQEGSLAEIAQAGAGDFEKLYARCTDVNFAPVYFGFDSTVVPVGELGKVDAVAQHLADNANRVVVVEGNCDERGSNEYNMSLGENRAIVIRNYLVQSGVSADRIQTRSYGEERPAVEGQGEAVWSKNRRGEFAIFQK
ncbi:MAG: OmpA family protein [Kiritimatiellia bacterium]